jgi:hypothetical protein
LFLNQVLLFSACVEMDCLIAAIPHVSVITFLIGKSVIYLREKYGEGDEEKTLTTELKEKGFYSTDRINDQIKKPNKPSDGNTDSNVNIENLLVLKVFILANKISSKHISETIALDMVDEAINKLNGSTGEQNTLRLIFYLLLKSEILRGTDAEASLREEAKSISEKTGSNSFRLFMKVQEATQAIIMDDDFQNKVFDKIDIDEQNLSEQEYNFLFKTTLKEMLEKHGIEYDIQI